MVEHKNITEPYWSNCFIEAIKAKIKHPFKIKITIIPPWLNEVFCPHFFWSDGEYDYDFGTPDYLSGCELFCFKGCIRQYKLGFNQKWIAYRRNLINKKKEEVAELVAKEKLHKRALKIQKKEAKEVSKDYWTKYCYTYYYKYYGLRQNEFLLQGE